MKTNDTLPQNMQDMIKSLSRGLAIPIGKMEDTPMLAVKVDVEDEQHIKDADFTSEFKASILNIEFGSEVFAMAYIQVRLNRRSDKVYTVTFDLNIQKQYDDCFELLNMQKYGLLVASDNIYEFISFNPKFEANFVPVQVLAGAKTKSTSYSPDKLLEISHALRSQVREDHDLWDYLNQLTPLDKSWYGYMKMGKQ